MGFLKLSCHPVFSAVIFPTAHRHISDKKFPGWQWDLCFPLILPHTNTYLHSFRLAILCQSTGTRAQPHNANFVCSLEQPKHSLIIPIFNIPRQDVHRKSRVTKKVTKAQVNKKWDINSSNKSDKTYRYYSCLWLGIENVDHSLHIDGTPKIWPRFGFRIPWRSKSCHPLRLASWIERADLCLSYN